jgi:hypothetical protein
MQKSMIAATRRVNIIIDYSIDQGENATIFNLFS